MGSVLRTPIPLDPNLDPKREIHRSSIVALLTPPDSRDRVRTAGHVVAMVGASAARWRKALHDFQRFHRYGQESLCSLARRVAGFSSTIVLSLAGLPARRAAAVDPVSALRMA
jgi:transposase